VPVVGPMPSRGSERPSNNAPQFVPWKLVTDLSPDDFEIFVDGQPRPVTSLSNRAAPVALVVLLDVSASTQISPDWLLEPLRKFLIPALKRGDRVAFGRFGATQLRIDNRFTDVPREMERRARELLGQREREMQDGARTRTAVPPIANGLGPARPDASLHVPGMNGAFGLGASPAWDAVDAAVTLLESQAPSARTGAGASTRSVQFQARAVILVTDGRSSGNLHSLDEVILHAAAADVPVSVVVETREHIIRLTDTTSARLRPGVLLQAMAEMTGGGCADVFGPEVGRPQRPDEIRRWLGQVLAQLVADLHNSYTLEFASPAPDRQLHRLEVRVRKPGLKVRARQAYLAKYE